MDDAKETLDRADAAAYYEALPKEWGFASRCKMTLLGDLSGKRVLDVDCRRGKGVIKLSSYVGAKGWAVGVDPSEEWIAIAESYKDDAWRRNGFLRCNMEYRVAFPEDLLGAGLEPASFDLVFANSSLWLDYDPIRVLGQVFAVLKPGGIFLFDGVVAEGPHPGEVIDEARRLGNAIQASWTREDFRETLNAVGFMKPEYYEELPVNPAEGVEPGVAVPVAADDSGVVYVKTTARIGKPF